MQQVQGLQAVDFVGLGRQAVSVHLAFLEVKDYREARNPPRMNELAAEIAAKVAGTLVGITSASRVNPPEQDMRMAAGRMCNAAPVHVFLHIERAHAQSAREEKAELDTLALLVDQKLAWLPGCRVIACSEAVARIPDCKVTTI